MAYPHCLVKLIKSFTVFLWKVLLFVPELHKALGLWDGTASCGTANSHGVSRKASLGEEMGLFNNDERSHSREER